MRGGVTVITGAQAAGKTTVAAALARRLGRAVHVDGDAVQAMVVAGAAGYTEPPSAEALTQLALRYDASVDLALRYAASGFDVLVSDNLFGVDLDRIVGRLHAAGVDVRLVVLDPSLPAIRGRAERREKGGYDDALTPELLVAAVHASRRDGLWLDSSGLDVAATVDAALARWDDARIAPAAGQEPARI